MGNFIKVLQWSLKNTGRDQIEVNMLSEYFRLWWFTGLWPEEKTNRTSLQFWLPRACISLTCLSICFATFKLFVYTDNIGGAVEQVCLIMIGIKVLFKSCPYVFQPNKLKTLCIEIERLHKNYGFKNENVKTILWKAKLLSKFSAASNAPFLHAISLCLHISLFGSALWLRKPIASGWYPCDTSSSPCLEIIALLELTVTFTTGIYIGLPDSLLNDFLLQTVAQLQILCFNVSKIHEFSLNKEKSMPAMLSSCLTHASHPAPPSIKKSIIQKRKVGKGTQHRVGNYINKMTILKAIQKREAIRRIVVEKLMKDRLIQCVQHHQKITRFVNKLQSFYYLFLLEQLLDHVILMTACTIILSMNKKWGLLEYGTVFSVTLFMAELFSFSYFSNEISLMSFNVKDALYSCDWLRAPESFKRSMRIIISRSNVPIVIRVGGFIPLSVPTFSDITRSTYSNFMRLKTVIDEHSRKR